MDGKPKIRALLRGAMSGVFRAYEHGWALAVLALAASIPPEGLDNMPSLCIFRALTGRPCLGCGMTRAVCHLAHGHLLAALDANSSVVVVGPIIVLIAVRQFWSIVEGLRGRVRLLRASGLWKKRYVQRKGTSDET